MLSMMINYTFKNKLLVHEPIKLGTVYETLRREYTAVETFSRKGCGVEGPASWPCFLLRPA